MASNYIEGIVNVVRILKTVIDCVETLIATSSNKFPNQQPDDKTRSEALSK